MARFLGRSDYLNAMFSYWHSVHIMKFEEIRLCTQTEQRVWPQWGNSRGIWLVESNYEQQLGQFIMILTRFGLVIQAN
jgi:hypothetical protein